MNIGLFVGSFNPITISHENIAIDLLKDKLLSKIYLVPVNSNKPGLIDISERISMINIIKNSNMEVLNIYNYSENGLFNYEILKKIEKEFKITHIIMGSDLFLKFNTFKSYKKILEEFNIIIITRNNRLNLEEYSKFKDKIIVINKNYIGSSKLAKENINNKNNPYLNKKILDYIKDNNLYN